MTSAKQASELTVSEALKIDHVVEWRLWWRLRPQRWFQGMPGTQLTRMFGDDGLWGEWVEGRSLREHLALPARVVSLSDAEADPETRGPLRAPSGEVQALGVALGALTGYGRAVEWGSSYDGGTIWRAAAPFDRIDMYRWLPGPGKWAAEERSLLPSEMRTPAVFVTDVHMTQPPVVAPQNGDQS